MLGDQPILCPCKSGKDFHKCHGAMNPQPLVPPAPAPVVVAPPPVTRKLDLAAGQNVREGFEGVDLWPGSQHRLDLLTFPWPFESNSVAELHCSHFVEHIPMEFVDEHGNYVPCGTPGSKDLLFKFFDEAYRVLVPDGWFTVITPCARNDRAFQDPTHRRFIVAQTFLYLAKEFRAVNKLDHYNVQCDFGLDVQPLGVSNDIIPMSDDARGRRMTHEWNIIADWICKLKSKKPKA